MAVKAQVRYGVSIRMVCRAFAISETCYRYQPKLSDENAEIADWLLRLTQTYKRWGFGSASFICVISKVMAGITNASIGFTANWN
jgi:hypothetical protein